MKINRPPISIFTVALFAVLLGAFARHSQGAVGSGRTSLQGPPKTDLKSPSGKPTFALLIGIDRYLSNEVARLDGAENDVQSIHDLLVQDYGFDPNSFTLLKGPTATAERIRKGLQWLVDQAKKSKASGAEAVVVLYYSGHGSQVDDPYREKPDGKSETIVPYDSRQGNVYDIVDHEINDFVIDLSEYTSNITLIFDSCHSGTVSRGDEHLTARLTPDDQRKQPRYERRHQQQSIAKNSVTLSAAASYQRAYERDKRRAEPAHGVFTYYLLQALKRASRATSYRELMQEVSIGVKAEVPSGQDVQTEGIIDSSVFGGAAMRAEPFIPILAIDETYRGSITFRAGAVHGVKEGTSVAIYDASAKTYKGSDGFLTNATVIGVNPTTAVARLPEVDIDPKAAKVNKLSKVVLMAPNFGGGPTLVDLNPAVGLVDPSTSKPLVEALTTMLGGKDSDKNLVDSGLVRLVTRGAKPANDGALLTLRRDKFRYAFPNDYLLLPPKDFCNPALLPKDNEEVWYLDDGTGRAVFGYFASARQVSSDGVYAVIERYARQRNLLALANNASGLSDKVSVTLDHIPGSYLKRCIDGQVKKSFARDETKAPHEVSALDQGQVFQLQLKNKSPNAIYVTVIDVSTDGSINIVYPDGANPSAALLPAGEQKSLPAVATTPPAGMECYVVFVTKDPTDFSFLQVNGISRGEGAPSLLERLLNQSGKAITRGPPEPIDNPDQWGRFTVKLNVTDKKAAPQ
jgi:hypothetical protein